MHVQCIFFNNKADGAMNWLKQWALFVVGWIESAHKLSSKSNFVCNSVCSTFLRNCKLISNLIRLKHGKSYELISRKIGYIKNPLATEAVLFSKKEMLYDWRVLELNLPLDEFYTTQCTSFILVQYSNILKSSIKWLRWSEMETD